MKKLLVIFFLIITCSLSLAEGGHRGKVINTMDVEGYTYAEIENNGKKEWIASTHFDAKIGDFVETSEGILMADFYSKSLKRTFKEIYFVTYVKVVSDSKDTQKIKEKPLEITLADFNKNKGKYNGKPIRFKALVTKVSSNIMGKNWLHVTGEGEKEKDVDIVVSTTDKANVNDKVVVEGVLTLDKNIGGGYLFPLFIEDGKITSR